MGPIDQSENAQAGKTAFLLPVRFFLQKKGRLSRVFKSIIVFFGAIIILFAILLGGLWFVGNQKFESVTINQKIVDELQTTLGEDFRVNLEKSKVSLSIKSLVKIKGDNLQIIRKADNLQLVTIDQIDAEFEPLSILFATPQLKTIAINGGNINLTPAPEQASQILSVQKALVSAAAAFKKLEDLFSDHQFEMLRLNDLSISNSASKNNRTNDLPDYKIASAVFNPSENGNFQFSGSIFNGISTISINGDWKNTADNGRLMRVGASNIILSDIFRKLEIKPENNSDIALDLRLRADARIGFSSSLNPLEPFIKLQAEKGQLRIRKEHLVTIPNGVANFQINPQTNQIVLQRCEILIGDTQFVTNGIFELPDNVLALDAFKFHLDFEKIANLNQSNDLQSISPNARFSGYYDLNNERLGLEQITIRNKKENLTGKLVFDFDELSPKITGRLTSNLITSKLVKLLWPFDLGPKARNWFRANVFGAEFTNLVADFAIPKARLTKVEKGGQFNKGELTFKTNFKNATVNLLGDLPAVKLLKGELAINGAQLDVSTMPVAYWDFKKPEQKLKKSTARISNIFVPKPVLSIATGLNAPLAALANLADRKPLIITRSLGIKPGQLSGQSDLDLAVSLPLNKQGTLKSLVKWKADLKVTKGASSKPLFGRMVNDATISLIAQNQLVRAKGSAVFDGIATELEFSEPINGGAEKNRSRIIKARLSTKDLLAQGVNLSPVVTGNIALTLISKATASNNSGVKQSNLDKYSIDLTKAELSLPWISWLKGSGIPANASFSLSQKDGINSLKDFKLKGQGFSANGEIAFNDKAIISADFKNVKLLKNDNFNVSIKKTRSGFLINANGRSFDGRGIINQLIHAPESKSSSKNQNVNLKANFGKIAGFQEQIMTNAIVNYSASKGKLDQLLVEGAINGRTTKVEANRRAGTTRFNFMADDAGAALKMVRLYKKMREGELKATLTSVQNGPYKGRVGLKDFIIEGEDRLASLTRARANTRRLKKASGRLQKLDLSRVKFEDLNAEITKETGFLAVKDGRLRNPQIGLTFDGTLYDQKNQMNVRGTFMPLFSISRAISEIPIIGDLLSNGKNSGLIGITYRLKGTASNPQMLVNPLSVIAPGIFRQIFQFQK